jgi:acyl-coenzyme A thioesterase PaaI-like protein
MAGRRAGARTVRAMSDAAHTPFPPDMADARARAARAIRDVGHALVGHHADRATLDALTAGLDGWTRELCRGRVRDRVIERPTGDWGPPPADGEQMSSYDERPVSGRASPVGLDPEIVRDGDEAVARLTLRSAHEGAPGRSHGGIVAALFDDLFGFVLTIHGLPAFTGELSIRYRAGTPIHEPLECRVRRTGQDGRKLHMTGELTGVPPDDGDDGERSEPVTYATATALFVTIEPEAFRIRV